MLRFFKNLMTFAKQMHTIAVVQSFLLLSQVKLLNQQFLHGMLVVALQAAIASLQVHLFKVVMLIIQMIQHIASTISVMVLYLLMILQLHVMMCRTLHNKLLVAV